MEAESSAFARELMTYVYNHYNEKNRCSRLPGCNLYYETIGRTVVKFHAVFSKFLNELSSVIRPEVCKNEKAFIEFAKTLLANYWRGYIFLELITICSCISYVAIREFGHPRFMELGCKLIAMCFRKLQWEFYAEGSWSNFGIYCLLYAKVLDDLQPKNRQLRVISYGA